ncbi:MAG: hypothetical protein ACK559_09800, partial [bacterium]
MPMENFFRFLIWIKFIPVRRNTKYEGWSNHFSSPKFIMLTSFLLATDGLYLYYSVHQLYQFTEKLSLADWSTLIFKILCLINAVGPPLAQTYPSVLVDLRAT